MRLVMESTPVSIGVNGLRCRGLYVQRKGMRTKLRTSDRHPNHPDSPWKDRYHFYACKGYSGWVLTSPNLRGRRSCLKKVIGRPKVLFAGRATASILPRQHKRGETDRHRVDFDIHVSSYNHGEEPYERESEIICLLDGRHCINFVAGNFVEPVAVDGQWECGQCQDSGSSLAKDGYIKDRFDTLDELILDHLQPTLKGIDYLCSASFVEVYLSDPENIENSSSAVRLLEDKSKINRENSFLIRIGKLRLRSLSEANDPVAHRMQQILQERLDAARSS